MISFMFMFGGCVQQLTTLHTNPMRDDGYFDQSEARVIISRMNALANQK